MLKEPVDLRSDTVTKPTPAMRRAMYEAEVGDDVYREDPTVNRLEEEAAARLGKEAGLFVTSGTQGNLISVLTHTAPGQEVILESESHIFYYEVAGSALIGGVQMRPLKGKAGALDPAEVEAAVRPENIHYPPTGLIALENTHNRAGGAVLPRKMFRPSHRWQPATSCPSTWTAPGFSTRRWLWALAPRSWPLLSPPLCSASPRV